LNGLVESENFMANGVQMSIAIGPEHADTLQRQLADLSRGRILLHAAPEQ
jgi:thymidylate synthase